MPKSDLVIWGKFNKGIFSKMLAGGTGTQKKSLPKLIRAGWPYHLQEGRGKSREGHVMST